MRQHTLREEYLVFRRNKVYIDLMSWKHALASSGISVFPVIRGKTYRFKCCADCLRLSTKHSVNETYYLRIKFRHSLAVDEISIIVPVGHIPVVMSPASLYWHASLKLEMVQRSFTSLAWARTFLPGMFVTPFLHSKKYDDPKKRKASGTDLL